MEKIGELLQMGIFPENSPKTCGDGEDIFWENQGLIGDGDKIFIREVWGMFPKIPPKSGWGRGKHCWGKLGTNWGRGQTCCWGFWGISLKIPKKPGWGRGRHFRGYAPL